MINLIDHCISRGIPNTLAKSMVSDTLKAIGTVSNVNPVSILNITIDIFIHVSNKRDFERRIRFASKRQSLNDLIRLYAHS